MDRAKSWIRRLRLEPHPEGGWYREVWRSDRRVAVGDRRTERSAGTSILYLLREGEVSRLHRIRADELWAFHDGGPLTVHVFEPGRGYRAERLGGEPTGDVRPQIVVPADVWFGAEPDPGAGFALVGCVVAPGFEFDDLELASRERMLLDHPRQAAIVERLTVPGGG